MLRALRTRLGQKYRTISYPDGDPPPLSPRFAGRPVIDAALCSDGCAACATACPTGAVERAVGAGTPRLDIGACLFCRACERACPAGAVVFGDEYRMAASSRGDLVVTDGSPNTASARNTVASKLFRRSLRLRQVSAGGCGACEADSNVLSTVGWDMGRFGIQFVASPRHADGLLITGPVTENMRLALEKTYAAVPHPKIVIAVGACAISGGPYAGHPEQHGGATAIVPVDLFIPGGPLHPLTILDGLLRLIGRIPDSGA